jgi:hypothetical protein
MGHLTKYATSIHVLTAEYGYISGLEVVPHPACNQTTPVLRRQGIRLMTW